MKDEYCRHNRKVGHCPACLDIAVMRSDYPAEVRSSLGGGHPAVKVAPTKKKPGIPPIRPR